MAKLKRRLRALAALARRDPSILVRTGIGAGVTVVLCLVGVGWAFAGLDRQAHPVARLLVGLLFGLPMLPAAWLGARSFGALAHRDEGVRRARDLGAVLGASVLIGLMAGLGALSFFGLLEVARHGCLGLLAGWRSGGPAGEIPLFPEAEGPLRPWVLFSLPALGGLLSGWLVYRFAPEAEGHGTDAAIDAYHHRQGAIRARVPFVKALASAITMGTGGSAGREGPIAQVGAGLASMLAQRLQLARRDRSVLMAAGVAGGIGAIFHAPLAGAMFASEVMYRELDLEHEVIVPSFISSIVAYSTFSLVFGWRPLFDTPDFAFEKPIQLLAYAALAVVVALGARLFVRLFYGVRDLSARWPLRPALRPALGGILVGVVAAAAWGAGLIEPGVGVLSSGYGVLQQAFFDPAALGIAALLTVALGKMLTTSFSIATGGSGGVFGPSVVIGGALGGTVGLAATHVLPGADVHPGAFVMVGMAGFFAAAGHAPLSTIIMVGEMTGNYRLLVPSMLVCVVAFLLVGRDTIFENQLRSRLDAPSKAGNMMAAVLARLSVRVALTSKAERDVGCISPTLTLRAIARRFAEGSQECFPLVDAEGRLTGVVEGRSLRHALADEMLADLLVAMDLATEAVTVEADASLLEALQRMTAAGREELIVVERSDLTRPVGTLSRRDIVTEYDRELSARLG